MSKYYTMNKADEMFKELGYKKEKRKYADVYIEQKIGIGQIGFNKSAKIVYPDINYINMQVLQAINEKCKELGWNE